MFNSRFGNIHRTDFVAQCKYRNIQLFPKHLQLFDSRRTIYVAGCEQRAFALFFQKAPQFPTGSGFTGTLQPYHHDNCWRLWRNRQFALCTAQQLCQLIVNDFYYLLTGSKAFHYFLAYCTAVYIVYKLFYYFIVNVGF